ncbi:MAG: hypothetical protein EPN61_00735 [Burkholderiaceae bacterium]|nr:MAG: hypothetical protein EPN61_00735 [Burkholderiaceae bacterium]
MAKNPSRDSDVVTASDQFGDARAMGLDSDRAMVVEAVQKVVRNHGAEHVELEVARGASALSTENEITQGVQAASRYSATARPSRDAMLQIAHVLNYGGKIT